MSAFFPSSATAYERRPRAHKFIPHTGGGGATKHQVSGEQTAQPEPLNFPHVKTALWDRTTLAPPTIIRPPALTFAVPTALMQQHRRSVGISVECAQH